MYRKVISNTGLAVSALGLGCMGMSEFYGTTNDAESLATLSAAIDLGVIHFDTADIYGMGHNEKLLNQILKTNRDSIILATKFGIVRDANSGEMQSIRGDAAYVKASCEASLQRLGIDSIDLYYLHRPSINTPIEETIMAMSELVKEGKVRYLGLSEAAAATIRRAHAIHPITAIQSEYSLWVRNPEREVLPTCKELGIGFVAYSPLGRGFLAGKIKAVEDLEMQDARRYFPNFEADSIKENQKIIMAVKKIAEAKNCSLGQVALAWVLAQGPNMTAIPGTKRHVYLKENCAAVNVQLTQEDVNFLTNSLPKAVGTRYPEALAKLQNIEN
jgi:aryl-alcohol dehydrogenase-like predicted oxidoreductase